MPRIGMWMGQWRLWIRKSNSERWALNAEHGTRALDAERQVCRTDTFAPSSFTNHAASIVHLLHAKASRPSPISCEQPECEFTK